MGAHVGWKFFFVCVFSRMHHSRIEAESQTMWEDLSILHLVRQWRNNKGASPQIPNSGDAWDINGSSCWSNGTCGSFNAKSVVENGNIGYITIILRVISRSGLMDGMLIVVRAGLNSPALCKLAWELRIFFNAVFCALTKRRIARKKKKASSSRNAVYMNK